MISSLDTNILMRCIWNDVPEQYEKAAKLLGDEKQVFYISDLVVSEIVYNLQAGGVKRNSIVGALSELFSRKNIMDNPFITDIVLPYFAEHPALSFTDCYAAFEAEKKHAEPLWTFDKKLSNQHPSAKAL